MSVDLNDEKQAELFRKVVENAIDAWLDKQYANFGKWTMRGVLAAATAGMFYLYVKTGGFKP